MNLYDMVVEQTIEYPKRMKYLQSENRFIETKMDSLFYVRNVHYPYGWLVGFGAPPDRHLDILLISDKKYMLGEIVSVKIVGVFIRNDGDNKLLAVLPEREENDYSQLPDEEKKLLLKLYPGKFDGEEWFGFTQAKEIIRAFKL